ncbi:hypothetical protein ACKFKG_01915 [Phormidesmis sp. 146-35]
MPSAQQRCPIYNYLYANQLAAKKSLARVAAGLEGHRIPNADHTR